MTKDFILITLESIIKLLISVQVQNAGYTHLYVLGNEVKWNIQSAKVAVIFTPQLLPLDFLI